MTTTIANSSDKRRRHWEGVYAGKEPIAVSWYQKTPKTSLSLIEASGVGPEARIVDVGGGASTLVDYLLDRGFRRLTVLDVAETALAKARERLGARADAVTWVSADVTRWAPPAPFDLWHDRAVFHFLTEAADRRAYADVLARTLRSGGHAVIATFAPDGPEMCSGLPVRRYSPETLSAELNGGFVLETSLSEDHVTPGGVVQSFQFSLFRKA